MDIYGFKIFILVKVLGNLVLCVCGVWWKVVLIFVFCDWDGIFEFELVKKG